STLELFSLSLHDALPISRAADKSISFTERGREQAAHIVRRHRLIERFLSDVFDIPWDQVHEEAERLEHWITPTVEERMLRAIGRSEEHTSELQSRENLVC